MPKNPWLVQNDKPSYQVLKWIGGGGYGQVFKVIRDGKVVACKQVHYDNAQSALDEYDSMQILRGAPHIAALHDGLEYNRRTSTLSFFMDYYRGKDLDRQVQMLRGAAERFSESQVIEISYQIAVALEFCHSRNILHQDMKPMNILLGEPWNPLTQQNVPDIFVADFGIASHVQNIGTRLTHQRGTPGYEAPEIRGQGDQARFSEKSDIYAFGCIMYRLCSLEDPNIVDDLQPIDISTDYSHELMSLVSSMLCTNRDFRPNASQIKDQLAAIALRLFSKPGNVCRTCNSEFISKNALIKHVKKAGHGRKAQMDIVMKQSSTPSEPEAQLKIRGCAEAPPQYHYDENELDDLIPSPCAVCKRHFDTKRQFFGHLYGGRHYRGLKYVQKRKAEDEFDVDMEKKDERLTKWIRKDMERDMNREENIVSLPVTMFTIERAVP